MNDTLMQALRELLSLARFDSERAASMLQTCDTGRNPGISDDAFSAIRRGRNNKEDYRRRYDFVRAAEVQS